MTDYKLPVQNQKTVTAHLKSKLLLSSGLARQTTAQSSLSEIDRGVLKAVWSFFKFN